MPRRTSVFLCALGVLLVSAGSAFAHGDLQSSVPAAGSKVDKAPDHIVMQLAEEAAQGSKIAVTDGCGQDLFQDYFTEGETLHVNLSGVGSPGKWTVAYQIVSAEDGHLVDGNYSFRVRGQKDCSADDPDAGGDDDGGSGEDGSDDAPADPGGDEAGDGDPGDQSAGDDTGTPTSDEGDGGGLPVPALVIGGVVLLLGLALLGRRASGT